MEVPTEQEVTKVLTELKNNKSLEEKGISAEKLKKGGCIRKRLT